MNSLGGFVYSPGLMTQPTPVVVVDKESPFMIKFTAEFNKSWLVCFDGSRNRSYFTYYSEFNRSSTSIVYVEMFFLCLLTVLSTVGNVLITYVVVSNKKMRTNTNMFIANMCIADVLFTATNPVIAVVRYQESWEFGACGFVIYNQMVCGITLIWSMTLISMDRHRCIVKTFYKRLTPMAAKIAIFVCWFGALVFAIPIMIYFKTEEFAMGTTTVKICTFMWPQGATVRSSAIFVTLSCIFCFLIPLTIIIFNYIGIFKTLWKTRKTVIRQISEQPKYSQPTNGTTKEKRNTNARNSRDYRVVKILVSTVVIFGMMWLPMCIVFLLILYDGIAETMQTSSWAFLLAACIAFANACINPVIYGYFNEKFRNGIYDSFRHCPMPVCKRTEGNSTCTLRSISALPDVDKSISPSSSSEQWGESYTSSIPTVFTSITSTETKIQ